MSLFPFDDMESMEWSQLGSSDMIKPSYADFIKAEEHMSSGSSLEDEDRAVPQTPPQGVRTRGLGMRATSRMVSCSDPSPKGQRRYKYYPDEMPAFHKHAETDVSKEEKNRQSARDCRLRKKLYMMSLEKKLHEAEAVIAQQQAMLKTQRDAIATLTRENQVLVALSTSTPTVPVSVEEPNSPTFQAVLNLVSSA